MVGNFVLIKSYNLSDHLPFEEMPCEGLAYFEWAAKKKKRCE